MRKKILILGVSLLSLTSYSLLEGNNLGEINSSFIREKGREYIRQGVMSNFLDREGTSRSNQYIEGILGKGKYTGNGDYTKYDSSTEGVVIGTTSQFNQKEESSWITGVSFGYMSSDVDYEFKKRKDKIETIGVNAYLGYRENNLLAFGYLGTGVNSSDGDTYIQDKKNISLGMEIGKIYSFLPRHYFYPYLGLDYSLYFLEEEQLGNLKFEEERYSYGAGGAGLSYFADYTKWQFKINARVNGKIFSSGKVKVKDLSQFEKKYDGFQLEGENILFSLRAGYYLAEDILLTFEALSIFNKDYRDVVYGFRISHNF